MENPIAKQLNVLLDQAEKAETGASNHGAAIKLTLNTATRIDTDTEAARAAAQDYAWAVAGRTPLAQELAEALAAGVAFCRNAKSVLFKHCGNQYCRLWDPVGFKGSLEVPGDAAGVKALLASMEDYFGKKTEHEVASLEVTAVNAGKARKAILAAEAALQEQDDLLDDKKEARDSAIEDLRTRLRGLINELTQLIGKDDRRWHSFGFNIPTEPDTPAQPENVSAASTAALQLHIACDPVAFADRYRFWTQPAGSLDEPVEIGSAKEPSLVLENLVGGARWKVSVSAVNRAGHEGPRSFPIEVTVLAQAVA